MSIRSNVYKVARYLGTNKVCRYITSTVPKIIMYHHFSEYPRKGYVHKKLFEQQVLFLKETYNVMSLKDLVEYFEVNHSYPVNTVILTIDDGYRDFYEIAYPILKQNNMSATLFITTKFVDGSFWLWYDKLKYIFENLAEINLIGLPGNLNISGHLFDKNQRMEALEKIIKYLLSINEVDKKQWINAFLERQNLKLPVDPVAEYCAVNWAEVKEMDENLIEIGGHTRTHPSLTRIDDAELSYEIDGSIKDMKRQLNHAPVTFCYPNGRPGDYNETVKKHVVDSGCKGAVTAFYDRHLVNDIYELRRFNSGDTWEHFMKVVNGIEVLNAKLFNASTVNSIVL